MQEALLGDGLRIAAKLQLAKAVVCRNQQEGSWGRLMIVWAWPDKPAKAAAGLQREAGMQQGQLYRDRLKPAGTVMIKAQAEARKSTDHSEVG